MALKKYGRTSCYVKEGEKAKRATNVLESLIWNLEKTFLGASCVFSNCGASPVRLLFYSLAAAVVAAATNYFFFFLFSFFLLGNDLYFFFSLSDDL